MQFWESPDELVRYSKEHITAFDALLLGRVTYQGLASVWPSMTDDIGYADWINSIPKHVVSTTLDEDDLEWNAQLIAENVVDEVAALKQQSGADILLIGSGDLLQTLMEHSLIDEYRLMVHPVVHGSGTQLFTVESKPTGLKLVEMETTDSASSSSPIDRQKLTQRSTNSMVTVFADMSMSLDGFVAGPNDSVEQPLVDGVRPCDWASDRRVDLARTEIVEGPGVTQLLYRVDDRQEEMEYDEP